MIFPNILEHAREQGFSMRTQTLKRATNFATATNVSVFYSFIAEDFSVSYYFHFFTKSFVCNLPLLEWK